jgi:hypothetical protein
MLAGDWSGQPQQRHPTAIGSDTSRGHLHRHNTVRIEPPLCPLGVVSMRDEYSCDTLRFVIRS